jgi:hypothetical protein
MKPGYRTTEFYGAITTALGIIVAAVAGSLSTNAAGKYDAAIAIGYAISRGLAKVFPPKPNG